MNKVDMNRRCRNVCAVISATALAASGGTAIAAGMPSGSALSVWLVAVSSLTLVGATVATVVTIIGHFEYLNSLRTN